MIEKKIHYCWFGGKPFGEKEKKCIESWKKFCKDYEIIEWNESNCDLTINNFVKQAYERKRYSFVSDYFRCYAVYNHGGIYLDTDVEIIKPLDDLLSNHAYFGIENNEDGNSVASGLGFGCEKNHFVLKELLDKYDEIDFIDENGKERNVPCPKLETEVLKKYGFNDKLNETQKLIDITIYSSEYFSPKSYEIGKLEITENTYSIHHYSMSWVDEDWRVLKEKEWQIIQKYGEEKSEKKIKRLRFWTRVKRKIRKIFTGK